jgi:hypothetical protein
LTGAILSHGSSQPSLSSFARNSTFLPNADWLDGIFRCGVSFDADFSDEASASQACQELEACGIVCSEPDEVGLEPVVTWTVRIGIDLLGEQDLVRQIDQIDSILARYQGSRPELLEEPQRTSSLVCGPLASPKHAPPLAPVHEEGCPDLVRLSQEKLEAALAELGSVRGNLRLQQAEEGFLESLAGSTDRQQVALAQMGLGACRCLQGELEAGLGWLRLAFRTNPSLKIVAGSSPLFGEIQAQPAFQRLVRINWVDRLKMLAGFR